jgi:tRNA nucleotidyltransferase/poly(A) polymerase
LLADANDRDLTANAIYLEFCEANSRLQFKIHDPTGQGISDYQEKILRFIGGEETENVESKLKEDPIRLLRLIYKAAKWNTDIPIEYEKIILDLLELEKKKLFTFTPKGSLVYWLHKLAKLENAARCKAELKKFKLFALLPYANDIFECQEKIKLARKNPANEVGLFLAAKSQALGALAEDLRPPYTLTKTSPS